MASCCLTRDLQRVQIQDGYVIRLCHDKEHRKLLKNIAHRGQVYG
jgi:hypothetical protein